MISVPSDLTLLEFNGFMLIEKVNSDSARQVTGQTLCVAYKADTHAPWLLTPFFVGEIEKQKLPLNC